MLVLRIWAGRADEAPMVARLTSTLDTERAEKAVTTLNGEGAIRSAVAMWLDEMLGTEDAEAPDPQPRNSARGVTPG